MQSFAYLRPASIDEAVRLARQHAEARPLAGGQSLLPAMRLDLNTPTHLIDLQDVPGLQDIQAMGDVLSVGAMVTHARIARSPEVQAFCPMLAALAAGIADEQVRHVGTLGGSLANNDPAACWPAAALALAATLVTDRREIAADDFFLGLFATALQPGELLVAVRFPRAEAAGYHKHEQPASRFAMVGVAVARLAPGGAVRIAFTGLGHGVRRWTAAEQALDARWSATAIEALDVPAGDALGDVHASAAYRAHLAGVMCRRCVAQLTGEPASLARRRGLLQPEGDQGATQADTSEPGMALSGVHTVPCSLDRVWQGMLDPEVLRACIPGCERLQATGEHQYDAVVKIGIGPVSARFKVALALSGLRPPAPATGAACTLQFEGRAGGLGHGQGSARVQLSGTEAGTRLAWQARTRISGRIAQFGNRLVEATANRLSEEFFTRFAAALEAAERSGPAARSAPATLSRSPFRKLLTRLERFLHTLFRRSRP